MLAALINYEAGIENDVGYWHNNIAVFATSLHGKARLPRPY